MTGRRAAKRNGEERVVAAYEYVCEAGHVSWKSGVQMAWGRQPWVTHERRFNELFGAVMPANPALQRTIGRELEEAIERQRLREEARREPPQFTEYDEIADPFQAVAS